MELKTERRGGAQAPLRRLREHLGRGPNQRACAISSDAGTCRPAHLPEIARRALTNGALLMPGVSMLAKG
jgi:hypothetical protein